MIITRIINFISFQLGWFVAAYAHNDLAAACCMLLTILNLSLSEHSILRAVFLAILATIIGVTNDYIIFKAGFIDFPDQSFIFLPLWIISLWFLFASTLDSCLAWLVKLRFIYIAIISGLGGAISYVAGPQWGAISYQATSIPAFLFHFINWFFLLPIILYFYRALS